MIKNKLLNRYRKLFKVLDMELVNDEYYNFKGNTHLNNDLITSILESINELEEQL